MTVDSSPSYPKLLQCIAELSIHITCQTSGKDSRISVTTMGEPGTIKNHDSQYYQQFVYVFLICLSVYISPYLSQVSHVVIRSVEITTYITWPSYMCTRCTYNEMFKKKCAVLIERRLSQTGRGLA